MRAARSVLRQHPERARGNLGRAPRPRAAIHEAIARTADCHGWRANCTYARARAAVGVRARRPAAPLS
jgi:hypothetical protein